MKILVLGSKEYPMGTNQSDDPQPSGGVEVYIDQLLPRLASNDLSFIVITRKFKKTVSYEDQGSIEVYRVGWIKGFFFRNLSFNLMSFWKALRLDFDLIFAQDLFATFLSVFLCKIKRKPLVSVFHGAPSKQPQYHKPLGYILGLLEKFSFNQAGFVVLLSPSKDYSGKVKNSRVIPLGVETEQFKEFKGLELKKKLGIDPNVVVISYIGRLIEVKGVFYLIKALTYLDNDFICLIVGSGPDEKDLIKLSRELGLNDKIRFLGFREDIPVILAATDIFVLPSLSEGLSISLLEAKAAGCACVVTDIGLPVVHRETALVVKPKRSDELSSAFKELIINKDLRKRLGENAKKDVHDNYSWKKVIEAYKDVFKMVI